MVGTLVVTALPAAAGALAVLLAFWVLGVETAPGWVAWLSISAGATAGEIFRRTW